MVKYGKRLIRSSLPLLKNFRFYFQFYYNSASSNQIEQIVASFSTPFYTHEKKWFIHCDLYTEYRIARFYSLPFFRNISKLFRILITTTIIEMKNIYANIENNLYLEKIHKI